MHVHIAIWLRCPEQRNVSLLFNFPQEHRFLDFRHCHDAATIRRNKLATVRGLYLQVYASHLNVCFSATNLDRNVCSEQLKVNKLDRSGASVANSIFLSKKRLGRHTSEDVEIFLRLYTDGFHLCMQILRCTGKSV